MKKAAFVLALVMLLGCVSGCGAAEGEASVQSVSMICGLGSVGLADRFAPAHRQPAGRDDHQEKRRHDHRHYQGEGGRQREKGRRAADL